MKVLVLGTNHGVQEKDYEDTDEFRAVLKYLIREQKVEVVMEEWTPAKGSTVGMRLSSDLNIAWYDVGTPSTAEFRTHIPFCDPMEEPPMVIDRFGPLLVHIKREQHMTKEIESRMTGRNRGLFIVGLAYLQSMSEKLFYAGVEVETFNWTTPPLRG